MPPEIEGGLFQYVVKVNDISYLFDSKGNGMMDEAVNHQGIAISEEGMEVITKIFKRYNISLEETQ